MAGQKWYHEGLRFKCTQCGNCCSGPPGYVWTTKEEIGRIAKFLGRTDGKLDAKHIRRVSLRYSLTEKPNGDCIFLKHEGGKRICGIYDVRPLQCRTWPFWNDNLRSEAAWKAAGENCPGMGESDHYDLVQIETIRTKKKWNAGE